MIELLSRTLPNLIPLLLPIICIILIAFFYALIFKRKLFETFFLSIATIILILFLCGLMNFKGCLLVGYGLIIAFSIISLGFLIKTFVKDKTVLRNMSILPSLLIFVLFIVIALFLNYKRVFYLWDEFSHWGIVVKSMYAYDALGTYKDSTIMLKSYLPGISLFEYFWTRPFVQFTEFPAYIASNMVFFSILSAFVKKFNFKNILLIGLFLLIPLLMGANFYSALYVDCLLGVLFGATFLFYYRYRYEHTLFGIVMFVGTVSILTLTKDMGIVLAGIIIFVVLLDSLIFKRKILKEYISKGSNIYKRIIRLGILISPILISLGLEFLWKINLKITGVLSFWKISSISIQDLLKGNLLPYQSETLKLFIDAILNKPLTPLNFSFLQIIIATLIFAIMCCIIFKKKFFSSKRLIVTFLSLTIGSILYVSILLVFYLFLISSYEALILASYERYTLSYVIGLFLCLLAFIILSPSKKKPLWRNNFFKWGTILISVIIISSAYIFLFNNTKTYIKTEIINARVSVNKTIALQEPFNGIKQWLDYSSFSQDRIYIISPGDNGQDKLKLIYTLYPTDIKWITDYSVALEPYYPELNDPWTKIITPTDWAKYVINNYDLVYIFKYDQKFLNTYGHLFDQVTVDMLYKVTLNDQGELKLISLIK